MPEQSERTRLPSRRDALRFGVASAALVVLAPIPSDRRTEDVFIPENDYPYFGHDPDEPGDLESVPRRPEPWSHA